MSDIFISYKREELATARKLANALENEGWTVWWDPKLRAGEHFDDVIEKALNEAKCVIVMWSKLSVNSEYIKAEATEALEQDKLVPVKIENVNLPFRFKRVHTPSLLGWDGSRASPDFRKFVGDISAILGASSETTKQADAHELDRIRQEVPSLWRNYGRLAAAVAVVLILFSFVFWWPKRQETERAEREPPKEVVTPTTERKPEAQPVPVTGKVFRDRLKSGGEGPEMVVIPAGSFQMGDVQGGGRKNELPVHTVRIEKRFAIGRYEVTFEDYDQFATATGGPPPDEGWGRGRQPVINVSWRRAIEYARWLSEQTGKRYRLPTEAEWEYAARGGQETAYWWGKDFVKGMANCDGCGSEWDDKQSAPVGSFKRNPFGIYDTAGNVLEWVEDCWHENYKGAPTDGSAWLEANGGHCGTRLMRGGSWGSSPGGLRASARGDAGSAGLRKYDIGFRLAQDLD